MSSIHKSTLSSVSNDITPQPQARIAIITSKWNDSITFSLRDDCVKALIDLQVQKENIRLFEVPGAFELPSAAKMVLSSDKIDAIICLGCVIKGETKHDDYISNAVAQGIANLNIMGTVPIIFGVLTTNNIDQAQERAGGKHGNKGIEAAHTALQMIELKSSIKHSYANKIGF